MVPLASPSHTPTATQLATTYIPLHCVPATWQRLSLTPPSALVPTNQALPYCAHSCIASRTYTYQQSAWSCHDGSRTSDMGGACRLSGLGVALCRRMWRAFSSVFPALVPCVRNGTRCRVGRSGLGECTCISREYWNQTPRNSRSVLRGKVCVCVHV